MGKFGGFCFKASVREWGSSELRLSLQLFAHFASVGDIQLQFYETKELVF
jgi:hypothetical protein